MKKRIVLIISVVSFIVFVSLYLIYENKGFEYGLGCSFCSKKMPYNLNPHDGSQFSFTLKDEDDLELVGVGFRYETTNFIIKSILAYGYNDTSVVVKCTDSLNTIRYLASYETGYKTKKGNPEISFMNLSEDDFEKIENKYQWFEMDKKMYYAIDRDKFLFILGALLSLVFIVSNLVKRENTEILY
jgi:hypothetical protein